MAIAAAGLLVAAGSSAADPGQSIRVVRSERLANLPCNSPTAVPVEYAPGGRSAAHRRAGVVFAYVPSGAIRSRLDDGPAIVDRAGESFVEPPGTHHRVSENASATEPTSLLAVFVAEDGAALTVFDE